MVSNFFFLKLDRWRGRRRGFVLTFFLKLFSFIKSHLRGLQVCAAALRDAEQRSRLPWHRPRLLPRQPHLHRRQHCPQPNQVITGLIHNS